MKEWKKIRSGLKWKNIFVLTLAGCINAFGVTIFLMPVKLYDSGISGTSMLLSQITPSWLSLPVFLIFLNIPLFLYGLKKQGPVFSIYAIYAVTIYSLGAWIITDILPVSVSEVSPLAGSDLLLCAVFGGIVSGLGSGLTIRYGGAMDGVEVLAIIFAKKWGMTVGTFVMLYNIVLYICCGIVIHSWTLPLYSIVTYAAALKTIDFVVEGIDRSKAAFIVTTRPETICEQLSEELVKDIQFCRGAEVYYFPGIGEAEEISRLCVEETGVMMLEMPFCQWDDQVVRDVQTLINKQKLTVIIVHIERYYPYQKKKEFWERVFELPVYAQVNAESFLHFRTRRKAFMLFEAYNALLGTDCHNMTNRIPNMQQAREVIQKKLGADRLRRVDELGEMILP